MATSLPSSVKVPSAQKPRDAEALASSRSPAPWYRDISWGIVLLPSALLAILGWMHRWTQDDAFINYRIVDQFLSGNGPVFNAGERVEAYTSTLWIVILAVADAVLPFVPLEWIGVGLGLGLAVAGLTAASVAARLLNVSPAHVALPLGALVFVALPPAWDFATSGLETGLSFAWLGGVFLALVVAERTPTEPSRRRLRPRREDLIAIAAGLGPLIRPDFAIFSVAFLGLLIGILRPLEVRTALRLVGFAAVVPVGYQVFRMGYFALLVPNTALAKEAGRSWWDQGLVYAWDTIGTYWLFVPLLVLLAWLGQRVRQSLVEGRRRKAGLLVIPVLAGMLHALFVVKVGGDYMHGRLMLPGLFAILMPVATLPVSRTHLGPAAAAAVVGSWAFICAAELRPPYIGTNQITARGLADDRSYYQVASGMEHPVTLNDYNSSFLVGIGRDALNRDRAGQPVLLLPRADPPQGLPSRPGLKSYPVLSHGSIGMLGYSAGVGVRVVDELGLADPVASRVRLRVRGRIGHEKEVDRAWVIARFSDPARRPRNLLEGGQVAQADKALGCGALREVLVGVSSPMTMRRFLDNLTLAPSATSLRFDRKPTLAEQELCR